MRASRLLRMLLLLQNRGRMTTVALAEELEVARRTVLRDIDALTEAGLPVITHRGQGGGVELGFEYRTRLTGLATDEAEALALILARPAPELAALGLQEAAARGVAKLLEAFPDRVRHTMDETRRRFQLAAAPPAAVDPRAPAMALAVRERRIVRLRARSPRPRVVRPIKLIAQGAAWSVRDLSTNDVIPMTEWDDVNISTKRFEIAGVDASR